MKLNQCWGMMLAAYCSIGLADPYYTGNPYTPYPPGCATLPEKQSALYGQNMVKFWSGSLMLEVVQKIQSSDPSSNLAPAEVDFYRVGCAEPGRSVIMAEFRLPAVWRDPRLSQLVLPTFAFEAPGGFHYVPLELMAEPHSLGQLPGQQAYIRQAIGDFTDGWDDARRFRWRYVLDMSAAGGQWGVDFSEMYNAYFSPLYVFRNGEEVAWIEIPRTDVTLQSNPKLPLNGRLSGTWVEEGSASQGFVLSFSTPVPAGASQLENPEDSKLLVFLSWFTFDQQGNALWLTGNARFPQGSSEVLMPIVKVTNGQFLGELAAERTEVGSARLKAVSCNHLLLEYELSALGLDSGEMQLKRFQALEIAGYPCRDYKARETSLIAGTNP